MKIHSFRFLAAASVLLCAYGAFAQDPDVMRKMQVGEEIRYTVVFKAPIELSRVEVRLRLQGEPSALQRDGYQNWTCGATVSHTAPTEYDLTCTVPKNIPSGVYKVVSVWAQRPDTISAEYPVDGERIRVENTENLDIPPVERVVPTRRGGTVIGGNVTIGGGVIIH